MMEDNLTQTELDFKESPNKVLEVTLDLISALVIISGFVGNILNAIVWYCQRGRSATYIYFIAISISNTLYCTFYFLKYSLDTFGFLQEWLEDDLCEISYDHWRYFIFHPCKEIFLSATIFFSVGLSAERYISITKPLQFNYLCTRNRTFRVITLLLFLAVAINLPLMFEYVHDSRDSTVERCLKPKKSALRQDPIYIWTYRVCLENLVKFMIPFVLMFFFNAGIINALKRSRRFRQSMSERRSTTPVRFPDRPWNAKDDDVGKKPAGNNDDYTRENNGGRDNDVDDDEGFDPECEGDYRKPEPGSNVAQKSFDMDKSGDEESGVPRVLSNEDPLGDREKIAESFEGRSELRSTPSPEGTPVMAVRHPSPTKKMPRSRRSPVRINTLAGSNVAQKSFDMEKTGDVDGDEESVVSNEDPLGDRERISESFEGQSELRSTPSPDGTPVMGVRRPSPTKKTPHSRRSPVRINTLAGQNKARNKEDRNCSPRLRRLFCRCFAIRGEDQKLSFLATCYVSIFLIFILPAVTRRGLFALRSTPEFSVLDTDELDYFRWISYLLDAIRPSTDFLLYMIVSTKFRGSFFTVVSSPCAYAAKWAKRCRGQRWSADGSDIGVDGGLPDCLLCGGRKAESTEMSEGAPFRRQV